MTPQDLLQSVASASSDLYLHHQHLDHALSQSRDECARLRAEVATSKLDVPTVKRMVADLATALGYAPDDVSVHATDTPLVDLLRRYVYQAVSALKGSPPPSSSKPDVLSQVELDDKVRTKQRGPHMRWNGCIAVTRFSPQLRAQVDELHNELDALRAANEDLQNELGALRAGDRCEELELEIESLQASNAMAAGRNAELDCMLIEARVRIQELEDELAAQRTASTDAATTVRVVAVQHQCCMGGSLSTWAQVDNTTCEQLRDLLAAVSF